MSTNQSFFENIQVSPLLITEFFANHLVIIDPPNLEVPIAKIGEEKKQVIEKEPVPLKVPTPPANPLMPTIPAPAYETAAELVWLGRFARKVMVLVKDAEAVHLGEAELDLLAKVLMAVKLSLNDVALVNLEKHVQTMEDLMKQLPATHVLLFGIDAAEMNLPMRFPHFQITRWNGCAYLSAPSLHDINKPGPDQITWKTGLWNSLKELFIP